MHASIGCSVLAGVEGLVTGCFPPTLRECPRGGTQVNANENTHMQKHSAIVNACQHEMPHVCQCGGHSHQLLPR